MRIIDLRSDTVTQPTPAMRKAMSEAEVGDDVYGEDPTVNLLQERCAAVTGKEAALFVSSGTMGNLVAVLTHCGRGAEVILGDGSHIFLHEQGGAAALGGIFPHTVPNRPDGRLEPDAVAAAIAPDDVHFPRSRLLCLENTWNGRVLRPDYMRLIAGAVRPRGLAIHLDGARIFNAATALHVPVASLTAEVDSVQFCFSKGLSAPVGSILCGSRSFIEEARRNRKLVGGGMRQAGVLAAACLVALDTMVERLDEDHANARRLAAGLADIPGIEIEPQTVETNIVFFHVSTGTADRVVQRLKDRGVLMLDMGRSQVRAVTHCGIEAADIDGALLAIREALAGIDTSRRAATSRVE